MYGGGIPISPFTWDGTFVLMGPGNPSRETIVDVFAGDISLALPLSCTTCSASFLFSCVAVETLSEPKNTVVTMRAPGSFTAGIFTSSFRLELSEKSELAEDTSLGSSSASAGRCSAQEGPGDLARDSSPSEGAISTPCGERDPPAHHEHHTHDPSSPPLCYCAHETLTKRTCVLLF